ncbi:MAG: short-chain fatty acid transporter, partial [Marinilabiliales bacterium]
MFKKFPHTYVIIFFLIIIAAFATWIVPGGEYERQTKIVNDVERTVIDKESFHYIDSQPQTWEVFGAMFEGFERQSGIIVFI